MSHPIAVVALGSNVGDSRKIVTGALTRLQEYSAAPLVRAALWQTTPVDCPSGSPMFVNTVAILVSLPGETPESLLGKLQALESEFGRRPKVILNEPRPLDLDLILFGEEIRQTEFTEAEFETAAREFVEERQIAALALDFVFA